MTYYTMLSLAPLLMIAIAIAGYVFDDQLVESEIIQSVKAVSSTEIAETVAGLIRNAKDPSSGWVAGMISLMVLLYGASGIFTQLFDTFNDIWQVPPASRSGLRFNIQKRLVGVMMVLVAGFLLIGTLALGSVISYLNQLVDGKYPQLTTWLNLADRGLSFILMPFVLSLIFWFFPTRKMRWTDVWPAAGLTAAMLAASRYLIDFYLQFSTTSEVYGAAGSLVVLLVWVYITGLVVFFGASFSCAWTQLFGSHSNFAASAGTLSNGVVESRSSGEAELSITNHVERPAGARTTTSRPRHWSAEIAATMRPFRQYHSEPGGLDSVPPLILQRRARSVGNEPTIE